MEPGAISALSIILPARLLFSLEQGAHWVEGPGGARKPGMGHRRAPHPPQHRLHVLAGSRGHTEGSPALLAGEPGSGLAEL